MFASGSRAQSLTVPFQSLIRTSFILTMMTLTSPPATKWAVLPLPPRLPPLLSGPVSWRKSWTPSSYVWFSRWRSQKYFSSSDPDSAIRASPPMVALMLEIWDELRLRRREARLEGGSGTGEPPDARRVWVSGRWETPVNVHVSCVSSSEWWGYGRTVVDEERDVGVGADARRLSGGRVGCHDNDGRHAVWRLREICVVHQGDVGDVVVT